MTSILLAILGLAFGSFVNALVWRLHMLEHTKKLSKKQKRELSIWRGRSMCPECRHELAWHDLVPVVSWVLLRGKCRYCGHKIEDSPFAELGTAGLFILSYLVWPYGFDMPGNLQFAAWLAFLVGFAALIIYDLKWMELPNKIVYPLIGLAAAQVLFLAFFYQSISILADGLWGFLVIGGFFYLLFQVSRGKWIGGGDVKLGFMIGPLVGGPAQSLLVIFFASLVGTFVSMPLLAGKVLKPTSRIPFGPFLLTATIAVYLFGERIVDWYVSYFL